MKHHDYLINHGKRKLDVRKQLSEDLFKRELESCTFKPEIIGVYSPSLAKRSERSGSFSIKNTRNPSFHLNSSYKGIIKDVNESQDEDSVIINLKGKSKVNKDSFKLEKNLSSNLSGRNANRDLLEVSSSELS